MPRCFLEAQRQWNVERLEIRWYREMTCGPSHLCFWAELCFLSMKHQSFRAEIASASCCEWRRPCGYESTGDALFGLDLSGANVLPILNICSILPSEQAVIILDYCSGTAAVSQPSLSYSMPQICQPRTAADDVFGIWFVAIIGHSLFAATSSWVPTAFYQPRLDRRLGTSPARFQAILLLLAGRFSMLFLSPRILAAIFTAIELFFVIQSLRTALSGCKWKRCWTACWCSVAGRPLHFE